jgi:hypothetical protein
MSNPVVDHQVQIALRDDQTAEKFAAHMAELTAQIANATFQFSQDVKSTYESGQIPRRRPSDKNFDEIDQAGLTLGAFSLFMHVLERYLLLMDSRILQEIVLDFIFENLVQVYAKSLPSSPAQTESFILNHYDRRVSQLAKAPIIIGEDPEDKNTVMWRAGRLICEEDLGRDDRRLLAIVETGLTQGLEALAFADHITAIAEALCVPRNLRKIA